MPKRNKRDLRNRDPTDDIEGLDAGAKLAILARVGLNIEVQPEQVDMRFDSARHRSRLRVRGRTRLHHPPDRHSETDRRHKSMRSSVRQWWTEILLWLEFHGSQNLVVSTGEFGGETVFSGHGAGGNPTAVAVVSDLLQAAKHRSNGERTTASSTLRSVRSYERSSNSRSMCVLWFATGRGFWRRWPECFRAITSTWTRCCKGRAISKSALPFRHDVGSLQDKAGCKRRWARSLNLISWSSRHSPCQF